MNAPPRNVPRVPTTGPPKRLTEWRPKRRRRIDSTSARVHFLSFLLGAVVAFFVSWGVASLFPEHFRWFF